jgi:DNA-binding response OmpR family regulator
MSGERILIVEDDPAVRRGLEYGLAAEGYTIVLAETGAQALALARAREPHLILLDLRLPDQSGFDVCRQLRGLGLRQPILMLTARDEEVDRVMGLELGADDYIVKPYSLRELIARIRSALRRAYGELSLAAGSGRLAFGAITLDLDRLLVTRGGNVVALTATEFRLLRHLAAHPNRPLSRAALIEVVWGYDSEVANDRTIDVHIRHLREKLEADPANPAHLVTVRGVGYKLQP